MNCPYCNSRVPGFAPRCASCGYPSGGTDEEKRTFLKTKMLVVKNDSDQALRHLRTARWFIFGMGLLSLMAGITGLAEYGLAAAVLRQLTVAAMFFVMGFLFFKSPVAVCAASLVLGFFIFSISLLSLIVLVFLGIGLYFALEARAAAKKGERLQAILE